MVWRQEGRTTAVGGEAHRVKEVGVVVSCSGSGETRWRTELDLGSGKSLDNHHGTATFGTDPKWVLSLDRGGFWFGARWLYWVE